MGIQREMLDGRLMQVLAVLRSVSVGFLHAELEHLDWDLLVSLQIGRVWSLEEIALPGN